MRQRIRDDTEQEMREIAIEEVILPVGSNVADAAVSDPRGQKDLGRGVQYQ